MQLHSAVLARGNHAFAAGASFTVATVPSGHTFSVKDLLIVPAAATLWQLRNAAGDLCASSDGITAAVARQVEHTIVFPSTDQLVLFSTAATTLFYSLCGFDFFPP